MMIIIIRYNVNLRYTAAAQSYNKSPVKLLWVDKMNLDAVTFSQYGNHGEL
jgi:hypothetical protein